MCDRFQGAGGCFFAPHSLIREQSQKCSSWIGLTIKIRNDVWCFHCLLGPYITLYSTVNIPKFGQINDAAVWEIVVSDNKFFFSCFEKYIVLWAGKICWATAFHLYSSNIRLQKDTFSRQDFKKISRTLLFFINLNVKLIKRWADIDRFNFASLDGAL